MRAPSIRLLRLIGLTGVACLTAILATSWLLTLTGSRGNQTPIAGDPVQYRALAAGILDGSSPYLEIVVEHLPVALLPMVVLEAVSRTIGASFTVVWPYAMSVAILGTVLLWHSVELEFDAGMRYLLLSLPLLPLLLFRVEPWVMLLVSLSLVLALSHRWLGSSLTAIAASLAKGWPILLFSFPFRNRHRALAVVGAASSVIVLAAIAATSGFQEGRAFTGIHTETVVGSSVLLIRLLTDTDLQLVGAAGAQYIEVLSSGVLLNALVGVPFIALGAYGAFRVSAPRALMLPVGLAVLGVIFVSPLFSAQFVAWLTPFVVFAAVRERRLFVVVSIITVLTVVWWVPTVAWAGAVVVRNIILVTVGIIWSFDVLRARGSEDPSRAAQSTSRRNLPV